MAEHKRLYDGDQFEHQGRRFSVRFERDDFMGAPWEEHDGHGIVSDWTNRPKAAYRSTGIRCAYCCRDLDDWEAKRQHEQTAHRARWIVDRMDELSRDAAREERRTGRDFDHRSPEGVEYRALMREWWTLTPEQYTPVLNGADARIPGPDYFRARTIARNATVALKACVGWQGGPGDPYELTVKAVRAVRKLRPDLFEGYCGSTLYGGDPGDYT